MGTEIFNSVGSLSSIISLLLAILFYILAKRQADKAEKFSSEAIERIKSTLDDFELNMNKKISEIEELSEITVRRVGKIK